MRNRIQGFFQGTNTRPPGNDGAFTSMGKRGSAMPAAAPKSAPADVSDFTSLVNRAYEENWAPRPKTDLARKAGVSVKMIDRMLKGESTKLTKEAVRVCKAIRLNTDAALRGEYAVTGESSDTEIHRQLDALLASKHGGTVRLQLESLYLSIARDDG